MSITIQVNTSGVTVMLAQAMDQLPYAMSLGLNRLANVGQKAEQAQMRRGFKLRREQFVVRGVKIAKTDRATKTSWRVTIELTYPDGRPFMDLHEQGGMRTRHGGRFLWQPNNEVFKSRVIAASNPLAPKNLHMGRTPGGKVKGDQRTFMVRTSNNQRLVVQRIGKDMVHPGFTASSIKGLSLKNFGNGKRGALKQARTKAATRLLYRLVERVRIPADLRFVDTIGREVAAQQAEIMSQAVRDALRSAR